MTQTVAQLDKRLAASEYKMTKARTSLLFKHPFFGTISLMLKFEQVTADNLPRGMAFPTMATDGRCIYYTMEFVEKHDHDTLTGVLVHEVMHVILRHMLRCEQRDPKLWNIATDLVINHYLTDWRMKLPANGVFPTNKPWSDFLAGKDMSKLTAEEVYHLIWQKLPKVGGGGGQGSEWGGVFQPTNADGSPLNEQDEALLDAEITQMSATAEAAAKAIGKMPSGLAELITKAQPPQVRWEDKLRRVIGGDRPEDYTYTRPNRRAFHMMRVMLPGNKKVGTGRIVIAVDTSGSVSTRELQHILGEINAVIEENSPEELIVIQCATKVVAVDYYGPGEHIPSMKTVDRGGTCVAPVFEYIAAHNIDPAHLIYCSDMEVDDIPKDPPHYPVLWVNTSGNGGRTAPWGDMARIYTKGHD
jgi:predicted metal-dependent peptidase